MIYIYLQKLLVPNHILISIQFFILGETFYGRFISRKRSIPFRKMISENRTIKNEYTVVLGSSKNSVNDVSHIFLNILFMWANWFPFIWNCLPLFDVQVGGSIFMIILSSRPMKIIVLGWTLWVHRLAGDVFVI